MRFERILKIQFPVFLNYEIRVIVTKDKKRSLNKITNRHKIIVNEREFGALHLWVPGISYLIFGEGADVNTITHECWHCVRRFMCEWAGGDLDNEIIAYHLGYLAQRAFDFIHKVKKRKKN